MNTITVNDWLFLSLIMSEVFANNDSIRVKSYRQVLHMLQVSYTDLIKVLDYDLTYDELVYIAGDIKDLVSWSDKDLAKVEAYGLSTGADLDKPIAEVLNM